jgi:hypothetical protein
MPEIIADVVNRVSIAEYRLPAITAYNRLEASPRSADFGRGLKAEIRDPLWMLTRQWQFGEFQGEDAASPVTAQILGSHTTADRVAFPDTSVSPYDVGLPLEVQVERETLRGNLFLATQMARTFLRSMREHAALGVYRGRVRQKYKLTYAIDKNDYEGAQLRQAADGRLFDGFGLYVDIVTLVGAQTRFQKWMEDEAIPPADQLTFNAIAEQFRAWFERNYNQPPGESSAWLPDKLEYQFSVASPRDTLTADQYYQGHLDWYSFDLDNRRQVPPPNADGAAGAAGATDNLVSFIPAPISFKGMPNPRFWMMEEQRTDFGAINASATGLLHLLLAEFGLIYSNDWFMLPYPLDINTLCEMQGITVTDVFGQHTLIRAAGRGPDSQWQRWTMFHLTDASGGSASANLFYLAPALTKSLAGEPLEQVNFLRDEMANLVWAVENRVPSQAGKGVSGDEMAMKDAPPPPFVPVNDTVQIRYVAGTTVPDNWIPFIPVHIAGSDRKIRLQRARLPATKGPLGVVLTEKAAPYYIDEAEIQRAGVIVRRTFQRARWLQGKTFLWIGRDKEAGKGEGWSNLQFDQIVDIPENIG